MYFQSNPQGETSEVISTNQIAQESVTANEISPTALPNLARKLVEELETPVGFIAGGTGTVTAGDVRCIHQKEGIILQRYDGLNWTNVGKFHQDEFGTHLEISGGLRFLDSSGNTRRELGTAFDVGDSLSFSQGANTAKITLGSDNVLDVTNRIKAERYVPSNTLYRNNGINHNTLWALFNPTSLLNFQFNVNGHGVILADTASIPLENPPFRGPFFYVKNHPTNTNRIQMFGFDYISNTNHIITIDKNMTARAFESIGNEFLMAHLVYCQMSGCPNYFIYRGRATKATYCDECQKVRGENYKRRLKSGLIQKRPNASKRGYDAAWQKCRSLFIKKYGEVCSVCGAPGKEVDHIKPVKLFPKLRLKWSNLRVLCRSCHAMKTHSERKK